MVANTRIDMTRLWELAKEGRSAQEIMKELDITDMEQLKQALQEAMREKGETVNVAGLVGEPGLHAEYTPDGIRISPAMLQETRFRRGDLFNLKVEEDRITLEKVNK